MVEVDNGELVGAALSSSTKEVLQRLISRSCSDEKETGFKRIQAKHWSESSAQTQDERRCICEGGLESSNLNDSKIVRVEVPLKNNNEFFQILEYGLSGLHTLHEQEKTALVHDIGGLGQLISQLAAPSRKTQQTDLYVWRAIFELYLDCNVFFATSENEKFNRTPAEVQKQLQLFSSKLEDLRNTSRFRRKDSDVALQRFLLINASLLRNLKFQQLNMQAAAKILKSKSLFAHFLCEKANVTNRV